jgi:hypothetical protein
VGSTELGDATVKALEPLTELESLTLSGTRVTAASVDSLKALRRLKTLRLSGTEAATAAREANLPVASSSPAPEPVAPTTPVR